MHTLSRPNHAANNVIPASDIRVGSEPVALGIPNHEPGAEPRVNLIRDGNAVLAIEIVCSCGERIVLTCVY